MKKLLFLLSASLVATGLNAQKLPQPSPSAKVEQTVGISEISIEYSRPGAKGRKVFGELVPFDKVWRFGANGCTKFTSNTEFEMGGTTVKAGTYSLFATPSEKGDWTITLNTDIENGGTGSYDVAKNVATIKAKQSAAPFTETFTLEIANVTHNSASIIMRWDKVSVEIPFKVNTEKLAAGTIQLAIQTGEDLEKVYYNAASYYFKSLNDEKTALDYIAKGMKVKDTFTLRFLNAQILHKQGKVKEAIAEGEIAHKMAVEAKSDGYASFIRSTVDSWK